MSQRPRRPQPSPRSARLRRAAGWAVCFVGALTGSLACSDEGPARPELLDADATTEQSAAPASHDATDPSPADLSRKDLDAAAPDLSSTPVSPDAGPEERLPGGWMTSTFVFAQGRLDANGADDDWVELGWVEVNAEREVVACGAPGPAATRTFYRWTHGRYPQGTCSRDAVRDATGRRVELRRWDHTDVVVDGCPGAGAWVEGGEASVRAFLVDCPAHVTAGFGRPEERKVREGHLQYDAAAGRVTFRYDVGGRCVKEYYGGLRLDPSGALLSLDLNGERTRDTSAASRGTGATHGYAFASSAPIAQAVTLDHAMEQMAAKTVLTDAWRLREARRGELPQPEHYRVDKVWAHQHARCREGIWFDHSCPDKDVHPAYLAECAAQATPSTAYLRFFLDPFPETDSREQLYWAWHAHHSDWSGCYHRGSHSTPLLQIIDSAGAFRGFVGIEMQRTQAVDDPRSFEQTDYKVLRWIEAGFE